MSRKPSYEELEQRLSSLELEVAKLRQSEQELLRRRKYLESILENSEDAIVTLDPEHRILGWNPSAQRLFGYSPEEARGKDLDDLICTSNVRLQARANTRQILSGIPVPHQECVRYSKTGEPVLVIASGAPIIIDGVLQGVVAFYTDIRLQKRAESALQESQERLQHVLEATQDGIWDWDVQTEQAYYSPGYFQMLGYEGSEFPEHFQTWLQLVHPEDKDRVWQANQDCIQGRTEGFKVEFRMRARDGSWRWIMGRGKGVRRDSQGKALRMVGSHVDITEQKHMEVQLHQARKMEALGTLAGGVAHDFNNVLQIISGYTQLMQDRRPAQDKDSHDLLQIQGAVQRAAGLVQNLLYYSRRSEPALGALDLNQEILETSRILKQTLPRMIQLETDLQKDLWQIWADPVQVEQVLINLASNAADAMPEGGRLLLETRNMQLDQDSASRYLDCSPGDYVQLCVSDTGRGMDEELKKKIFDPFFTTKAVGQGTGLGLASVYGITQSLGGQVLCYSEEGRGTVFRIYFPAYQAETLQPRQHIQDDSSVEGTETILVVDDEPWIRELTQEALQGLGYRVVCAPDGETALEIYQSSNPNIDLVVLDLSMPGMGGRRCLQEILELDPGARVLLSSGYAPGEDKGLQEYQERAVDFLGKPFQLSQLAAKIRQLLDREDDELAPYRGSG
ncbi:MAG: PAS domain S-box protein [Desulfohalobiaceae bacterium]